MVSLCNLYLLVAQWLKLLVFFIYRQIKSGNYTQGGYDGRGYDAYSPGCRQLLASWCIIESLQITNSLHNHYTNSYFYDMARCLYKDKRICLLFQEVHSGLWPEEDW